MSNNKLNKISNRSRQLGIKKAADDLDDSLNHPYLKVLDEAMSKIMEPREKGKDGWNKDFFENPDSISMKVEDLAHQLKNSGQELSDALLKEYERRNNISKDPTKYDFSKIEEPLKDFISTLEQSLAYLRKTIKLK